MGAAGWNDRCPGGCSHHAIRGIDSQWVEGNEVAALQFACLGHESGAARRKGMGVQARAGMTIRYGLLQFGGLGRGAKEFIFTEVLVERQTFLGGCTDPSGRYICLNVCVHFGLGSRTPPYLECVRGTYAARANNRGQRAVHQGSREKAKVHLFATLDGYWNRPSRQVGLSTAMLE